MNIPSRPDCCLWYSYRHTTERRLNKHYSLVKNMTLRSGSSAAVTSATTSQGSAACLCFSSKTFPFDHSPAPCMCFYQHLHVRMFSFTVHLHDIPFWVFFGDIMFLIWQRKNVLYNKRYGRVRTRAHPPLSHPEVHRKQGCTRYRHCHRGIWEKGWAKGGREEQHLFSSSPLKRADLHNTLRGNPTWKQWAHVNRGRMNQCLWKTQSQNYSLLCSCKTQSQTLFWRTAFR